MLHRVLPEAGNGYYFKREMALSRSAFYALLDSVAASGLPVVLPQAGLAPTQQPYGVCFSFDDGYVDNAWAFERLQARSWQSVLFVVQDFAINCFSVMDDMAALLEGDNCVVDAKTSNRIRRVTRQMDAERYRFWRSRVAGIATDACSNHLFLSESELADWSKNGVQLGVHGVSHRVWSSMTSARLLWELQQCERWIQTLSGTRPELLAFPHGKVPNEALCQSLLTGKLLFGVDRCYDNPEILRRVWVKETSNVKDLLQAYKNNRGI